MIIGIPKEIKTLEYRMGTTPREIAGFVTYGHQVLVEKNAGAGAGFPDDEYIAAGATILNTSDDVWDKAEMIYKVKEPLSAEYPKMKEGQIVFTYFHLAPDRPLTDAVLASKCTAIAFETIEKNGTLPCLTPMSEIAGRMSIQCGATYLQINNGGRGVLLGGVPGEAPANVVIVGGGIVGTNAAKMAVGLGANVSILDIDLDRLRYLDDIFTGRLTTLAASPASIAKATSAADLVIGAVLVKGAKAPRLVTREMVAKMPKGSVIVDVAIDQGGCVETAQVTYHDDPVYTVDGVLHYCVGNIPGAVARTSTLALANATFPYALKIANQGWKKALRSDQGFLLGLNAYAGTLTCPPVGEAHCIDCVEPKDVI
jgi:alanine dehydrogenase